MVTTISFTTIGLPVSLLCVYLLHYHLFTFCATVCLPFVLLFVYLFHYHLFTVCLHFVLLFVYVLYYRAKMCHASICRHSASWPNECPSAVVQLSIPHKFKVVGLQVSVLTHHRTQPMGISNEYVEQYKKRLSKDHVRRLISSPRNILNCP